MVEDKRIDKACNRCGSMWLIESQRVTFKGDARKFMADYKRKPGHCYCGVDLYEGMQ